MSDPIDLDLVQRLLSKIVTPEKVNTLLLVDIARSLRMIAGRTPTVADEAP